MPAIQSQSTQQIPLPAPVGGINAVSPATVMPPTDALTLVNMIGGRLGVTSRLGYQTHSTGMTGEVRTVIPFAGRTVAADRLFGVTQQGIYDATSSVPLSSLTFGINSEEAGWGVFTTIVTNGGSFAFYADEANGLFRYGGTSWAAVTDITGPAGFDVTKVAFVTVWKNRLWMVQRDSGDAYFLEVGTVAGAAQRHSFGNKFRTGGYLVGLWNWTRDGGSGMDDFLTAVSSTGDVLVYQGSDPAVAGAFELVGDYSVGAVPAGRRIATDFGGDLLILSKLGIMPMSRAVSGTVGLDQYTTQKIQPLFNSYTTERGAMLGWSLRMHPEDNALIVNIPQLGNRYEQLAMSLATQGWSLLDGVPSVSSEVWRGQLYFGTPDGRICVATGGDDEGAPVNWWGQTAFQAGDSRRKRVHQIQPLLTARGVVPGVEVRARYDFHQEAIDTPPVAPIPPASSTWGTAHWNQSHWGGGTTYFQPWRGANGSGTFASISFRGRSTTRTTLLGFNTRFDEGGIR